MTFLEHCPVEHLVYVSSGAVYDGLIGAVSPATAVVAAAAVRDLEAGVGTLRPRSSPSGGARVGSYINVRFFGAYGPYEPARKITTRWLRGADATASASSRFAATART